ncbi:MAG: RNA polymerase factor sigma-32 [Parvularculales bacterium]
MVSEEANIWRSCRFLIRRATQASILTPYRERELARLWITEQDETALHELVNSYLRLAIAMAKRFRHYGLPVSDLVQEASVGLMQAAQRFEPDRGVRFSVYAGLWIRSTIQDYVLRNWSIVRTGTTKAHRALFFNLNRLKALLNETGDMPLSLQNRQEIARRLQVPPAEVDAMEARLSARDQSLDTHQDILHCPQPLPEETAIENHDRAVWRDWLYSALKQLSEREQIVIRLRRLQEETVTLERLGEYLGVSKQRVRQIEQRALDKLCAALPQYLTAGL